ncbi:MAG: hypothetical protein WCH34_07505 [Bacteroidota bacterium]
MSAIIKTITPFLNKELLLNALDCVGCKYWVDENEIVTERIDFSGNQTFIFINGRYQIKHYNHESFNNFSQNNNRKPLAQFLQEVEKEYNFLFDKKMEELEEQRQEEERIRIEKERKAFVEQQKENIIAKAKEKGYSVKEENVKGKIKLILVRNTY